MRRRGFVWTRRAGRGRLVFIKCAAEPERLDELPPLPAAAVARHGTAAAAGHRDAVAVVPARDALARAAAALRLAPALPLGALGLAGLERGPLLRRGFSDGSDGLQRALDAGPAPPAPPLWTCDTPTGGFGATFFGDDPASPA